MGYIKFQKILVFMLLLIIGFNPVASGFATGSDCVKMCSMNSVMGHIEFKAKTNIVSLSKGCCSENPMIPCDIMGGKTDEIPEFITNSRVDVKKTKALVMVASSDFIGNTRPQSVDPNLFAKTLVLSTPIYLENLSLLF